VEHRTKMKASPASTHNALSMSYGNVIVFSAYVSFVACL